MKLEDYAKPVGGGLRPATLVRTHTQTDGQTRNILSYDQLWAASLIGRNAVTWRCALSYVHRFTATRGDIIMSTGWHYNVTPGDVTWRSSNANIMSPTLSVRWTIEALEPICWKEMVTGVRRGESELERGYGKGVGQRVLRKEVTHRGSANHLVCYSFKRNVSALQTVSVDKKLQRSTCRGEIF